MKNRFVRVMSILLVLSIMLATVNTYASAAKNACTPTIYGIKQVSSNEITFKVSGELTSSIEYAIYNASNVVISAKNVFATKSILKGTAKPGSTVKCKIPAVGKYYILVKSKTFQTTPEVFKTSLALQKTEYSKWIKWDKKTINKYKAKKAVLNITGGVVVAVLTYFTCGSDLLLGVIAGGGTAAVTSYADYTSNKSVFTCSNVPTNPAEDWKWRFRYEPDEKKEGFYIYLEVKDATGKDAYCNNQSIGYTKTAW